MEQDVAAVLEELRAEIARARQEGRRLLGRLWLPADAPILIPNGSTPPPEATNTQTLVAGAGISIPDGHTVINTGAFVPPAHASTHAAAGSDQVTLSESQITGLVADLAAKLDDTQLGAASGVASLNGSTKVVEDPANATSTATASKIPIADGSGKLDTWVSDAAAGTKGKIQLAGALGGTAAAPTVAGRHLLRTVYKTATSGTHTFSANTNKVHIQLRGPGGGGGGVAGAASNAAAGGGGGAGAALEAVVSVTPSSDAAYNVPAGGAGGTAGANPGSAAASDTTITIGATTYTAAKGNGGATAAAGTTGQINAGGTGGAATNGDPGATGSPGQDGIVLSATVAKAGNGAQGWEGAGGAPGRAATNGAGTNATGNGAGGSGARQVNNAANSAGGDGSPGLIIVDEYS